MKLVSDALETEQIDVSRTRIIDGPNEYSMTEPGDGDPLFGLADVGTSRFFFDEDNLEYPASFDIVHSGGNSFLENRTGQSAEAAPVLFDFGERPADYWMPYAPYIRVVCFSTGQLSPKSTEQLARSVANLGPEFILVADGVRAAKVLHRDRAFRIRVTPIAIARGRRSPLPQATWPRGDAPGRWHRWVRLERRR